MTFSIGFSSAVAASKPADDAPPALVFITDGHEAPPINPHYRLDISGVLDLAKLHYQRRLALPEGRPARDYLLGRGLLDVMAGALEQHGAVFRAHPGSRGGRHEWTNVVAACRRHNMQKGDRLLEELGWRLHFEPRAPDGPWWRWRHVADPDPLWAPYLPRAS